MMRAAFGALLITMAMVTPSWAQSGTGVSVALVGDIARYNGSESNVPIFANQSRDGEALGFSLRVDRALGSRWGVELEYVRGGEIESEARLIPLSATQFSRVQVPQSLSSALSSFGLSLPPSLPILPPQSSTTRARMSTVSTLAWYRQSIGERTSLVYSGGVGFGINRTESTFVYIGLPTQSVIPATSSEFTSYTVNPIVGFDARISMTEHASLVPGVRVIGAQGGILVRPSVGLRWEF